MKNKEWNEAVHNWMSEEGYTLYSEQLEKTYKGLQQLLRYATEDHRYIQGKLDAYEEQMRFKEMLRTVLDSGMIDEED